MALWSGRRSKIHQRTIESRISKRDLKTPAIGPENEVLKEDMEEYLSRIYLFWTPHPGWRSKRNISLSNFERKD